MTNEYVWPTVLWNGSLSMNSCKGTYVDHIMIDYEPWPTDLWNGSVLWNFRQCGPDQCTRIISCSINEMKNSFKSMTFMMYDCSICDMIWLICGHIDIGDMCLCKCFHVYNEPWFMTQNWMWLYNDAYDFLEIYKFVIIFMNEIWEWPSMTWWL